jgi:hypothetical protein
MCRSIKRLREQGEVAGPEEIEAAALQFVRKISGMRTPTTRHEQAFKEAVAQVTATSSRLLTAIDSNMKHGRKAASG